MEIRINREIRNYTEAVYFGLTLRQFVCSLLSAAAEKGEPPFLIVLDELEDPHNLGAIIRTAECIAGRGREERRKHEESAKRSAAA